MTSNPHLSAFLTAFVAYLVVMWAIDNAIGDTRAGCVSVVVVSLVLASIAVAAMIVGETVR